MTEAYFGCCLLKNHFPTFLLPRNSFKILGNTGVGNTQFLNNFFLFIFFIKTSHVNTFRFAQKQMKSGLGKNGGEGETGVSPPPRTPFVLLNSYLTLPKMFLEKLEYICRSNKKYFWPNCLPAKYTSAWKKMLPKWQFSFYPFCIGRKWPKCFKKFLANVLTLYSSN